MPSVYKVLGQVKPVAATLTTLYTVPAAKSCVVSTLAVCNLGISTTVRVAVRPVGAGVADNHYILYDTTVSQFDSLFLTLGITLGTTDVVSVYAGTATVAFNLYGSEIT